jgi:hypothetical protein
MDDVQRLRSSVSKRAVADCALSWGQICLELIINIPRFSVIEKQASAFASNSQKSGSIPFCRPRFRFYST